MYAIHGVLSKHVFLGQHKTAYDCRGEPYNELLTRMHAFCEKTGYKKRCDEKQSEY